MKLSRTVAYALQATLQLAQSNALGPVPCSQLAADGNMPERFLLQILRSLVAHGILSSTRGVDGGYTLDRGPEEISLLEIIEAIEGPLCPVIPVSQGLPPGSKAKLQDALACITDISRKELQDIKIAHLLPLPKKSKSGGPSQSGDGKDAREGRAHTAKRRD
jgi:Rrf2 family transcriptional regulator, cysteine metabolism repressor